MAMSGVFLLFFLVFVVGGLAVMIYALVDAIRMPSDADFKAGTLLVLDPRDPSGASHRRDHLPGRGPSAGRRDRGARAPASARVDPTATDRSRRLTRC
jgi:hypothetical protein